MQRYVKLQMNDLEKIKKLNVAVLCGGVGTEVEISLESGHAVYEALKSSGLNVRKVIVDGSEEQILNLDCDLAFIALHGKFGEDGTIQHLLERRRIPFTGSSSQVSKLCMDKNLCKTMLQRMSVPVAPWICVSDLQSLVGRLKNSNLKLPLVVKPNSGGSSVGVVIAKTVAEVEVGVRQVLESGDEALIEEYVSGVEFTVGLLDGKALPIIEMRTAGEFYDYHAKYNSEDTQYLCPPESICGDIQAVCSDLSCEIYRNFKLRDLSRIDYILGSNGNLVALEINTIPGFTSHSLVPKAAGVSGVSFAELCLDILNMAYLRMN